MNRSHQNGKGMYFGIEVVILVSMEHCCLIRFQDREFIVDTADLTLGLSLAKAA